MTISQFLSALSPAEGCTIKMLQNGEVVTKCYAAYWSSLSETIKASTIESFVVSSATSIIITIAEGGD